MSLVMLSKLFKQPSNTYTLLFLDFHGYLDYPVILRILGFFFSSFRMTSTRFFCATGDPEVQVDLLLEGLVLSQHTSHFYLEVQDT